MKDKDLLELAAKASDLHGEWSKTIGGWDCLITPGCQPWQPLHDDGDALRLAVELGLEILTMPYNGGYSTVTQMFGVQVVEPHKDDAYAATRRAIVRAAAEIGKAMP